MQAPASRDLTATAEPMAPTAQAWVATLSAADTFVAEAIEAVPECAVEAEAIEAAEVCVVAVEAIEAAVTVEVVADDKSAVRSRTSERFSSHRAAQPTLGSGVLPQASRSEPVG